MTMLPSSGGRRPSWILASASPRRREILKRLGVKFRVVPSSVSEPQRQGDEAPSKFAVRLARLKAREVAKKYRSGIVIGADTIVVLGNRFLGKPASEGDARSMLRGLSGRWHEVITGLCLVDLSAHRERTASTISRVHFRRLSSREIEWYLRTREYRDKAGAYAIQGLASLFIDRIEGCYFNIVGFPIATFDKLRRKMGDSEKELDTNSMRQPSRNQQKAHR